MAETARDTVYMPHSTPKSYTHFSGIDLPPISSRAETFLKPLFRMGTAAATAVHQKTDDIPLFRIYATSAQTTGTNRIMYLHQTQTATKTAGYERVLDVIQAGNDAVKDADATGLAKPARELQMCHEVGRDFLDLLADRGEPVKVGRVGQVEQIRDRAAPCILAHPVGHAFEIRVEIERAELRLDHFQRIRHGGQVVEVTARADNMLHEQLTVTEP